MDEFQATANTVWGFQTGNNWGMSKCRMQIGTWLGRYVHLIERLGVKKKACPEHFGHVKTKHL